MLILVRVFTAMRVLLSLNPQLPPQPQLAAALASYQLQHTTLAVIASQFASVQLLSVVCRNKQQHHVAYGLISIIHGIAFLRQRLECPLILGQTLA